jgi:hypothetical protein
MRLLIPLILAGGWAVVQAEAPVTVSPTAQMLDRGLREIKGGLLVMVDGPKGEWKAKVDALTADSEWLDLELGVTYYGSKGAEIEALLRQKYQAGPRPMWVLFGAGPRVLATGGSAPDAKAMVKAVQESGIRSMLQILRDFARLNPDHLEARGTLCAWLRPKASKKTLLRTGGKVEPLRPTDEPWDNATAQKEREAKEEAKAKDQQDEKPPVQLGPEEDQAIWGELADLLAKSFRSGDWIEMPSWSLTQDEAVVHSPLMQEMSRAAVPEVERALVRNPTAWNLWQVWLGLTRTFGGKPIRPLLDSLVPVPTHSTGNWPPYSVRDAYVQDARKRKDWTGIRDLLLPQIEISRLWEAAQEQKTDWVMRKDGKVQEAVETGDYWRDVLEPLVEALIWLGDASQADGLVRDRFSKHPWSGLTTRAARLALRCNQPNLAAQWGALGVGK